MPKVDHWHELAACRRSPVSFFPEKGGDPAPALAICATCPVSAVCASEHVPGERFGVWAGTTETDRNRLRKDARQAA